MNTPAVLEHFFIGESTVTKKKKNEITVQYHFENKKT